MLDLHVILDIDQTMIDSMSLQEYSSKKDSLPKPDYINNDVCIWMRPHLPQFLSFLDKNVKYISIWTNGSGPWLFHVVNNVISKYINPDRFYLLLSIDYSSPMVKDGNVLIIKDIGKAMKMFPKKDISLKNTIIIDDNYHNCSFNKYNSIPIKKFLINDPQSSKRTEFLQVMDILKVIKNSENVSYTLKNVYNDISDYNKLFTSVL